MKFLTFLVRLLIALAIGAATLLLILVLPVRIIEAIWGGLGRFAGGFFIGFIELPLGVICGVITGIISFRKIRLGITA